MGGHMLRLILQTNNAEPRLSYHKDEPEKNLILDILL